MLSIRALAAVLVSFMVLMSGSALAAKGFSHSYADVGYLYTDGDDYEVDSVLVDASFELFDYIALRAAFKRGAINDYPGDSPDLNEFRGGLRGFYSFADSLDVYGDAMFFNAKLNGNNTTETDIGGLYEAGIRYQLAKKFEIDASYRYISGDLDEGFLRCGRRHQADQKLCSESQRRVRGRKY